MSAKSIAAFGDLSKARRRVQTLVTGLRAIGSGEALERAVDKIQEQVDAVAHDKAGRHVETGQALASVTTRATGGLIQLSGVRYLNFHGWWPFRRGMPPFVLKRAALILATEVKVALGGTYGSLGELAGDVLGEAAEGARTKAASAEARRLAAKARRAAKKGAR
jgi:hypothetical protein